MLRKSKRLPVVALSSAEGEFVTASALVQQVIYTSRFLDNLGFPQTRPTYVYKDNSTSWHVLHGQRALSVEATVLAH